MNPGAYFFLMRRLAVSLLLLLVMGCSSIAPPAYSFTIRHPQMNYMEFIARADLMVENLFPEWYVEGTPIGVDTEQIGITFASVQRLPDGRLAIELYPHGYHLATVEDLASVLLHEYVHVRIWDELETTILNPLCNAAVHEIMAYGVELAQTKLTVTDGMKSATRIGYELAYSRATVYCYEHIMKDFPLPQGYLP